MTQRTLTPTPLPEERGSNGSERPHPNISPPEERGSEDRFSSSPKGSRGEGMRPNPYREKSLSNYNAKLKMQSCPFSIFKVEFLIHF
jgi:hypothetical protein